MTDYPERKKSNPIHCYDEKWWFWDETWSDRMGPFDTEEQTEEALRQYCKEKLSRSC